MKMEDEEIDRRLHQVVHTAGELVGHVERMATGKDEIDVKMAVLSLLLAAAGLARVNEMAKSQFDHSVEIVAKNVWKLPLRKEQVHHC